MSEPVIVEAVPTPSKSGMVGWPGCIRPNWLALAQNELIKRALVLAAPARDPEE